MKHLVTRITIASLVAVLASTAALVEVGAAAAQAAPTASPSVVNTMPARVLQLDWIEGQAQWRDATAARLVQTVFQFSRGGRFTLIQPGFADPVGSFRVSGNRVQFSGKYVQTNYPSGQTIVAVAGTLDLRTGRTVIGYEARSILVANINGQELNQSKVMSYRAVLVLRRI